MGKFNGGFGGGGGNMQQLLKQAQEMQRKLQEAQEELKEWEVVGTAGAGMVEVVLGCDYTVTSVKIKKEAVDPDDVEMLEDLIVAGLGDALKNVELKREEILGPVGGSQGGLF